MSTATLSYRMTGKDDWNQTEMLKAMSLLDIPASEVADYFFSDEVQDLDFWKE